MTTNHRPPAPAQATSLRELARVLRVSHSSLSAAVHDGRLSKGVTIEAGSVVVTDAAKAVRAWRAIHTPRTLTEISRSDLRCGRNHCSRDHDTDDYFVGAVAGTLVALLIERAVSQGRRRATAIAELRTRFGAEVGAYLVDDNTRALAHLEVAISDACNWLDEREP